MTTAAATGLRDQVTARGHLVGDGAMGTLLQDRGWSRARQASAGTPTGRRRSRPSTAPTRRPGAGCLTTNTFGGTSARLAMHGLDDRVADINREAARIAAGVASEFGALVAGDIGPSGELIEPLGTLSAEAAREMFAEQAAALAEGGADFILIETMSDLAELEAAILGARDAAPQLEIAATMSFDTNRRTMMGVSPAQAVVRLAELEVVAAGANCGRGPGDMEIVMAEMAEARPEGVLLLAQTNAGMPHLHGDHFEYDVGPQELAEHVDRLRGMGVEIVGACCGSTPAHIAAIASALS